MQRQLTLIYADCPQRHVHGHMARHTCPFLSTFTGLSLSSFETDASTTAGNLVDKGNLA